MGIHDQGLDLQRILTDPDSKDFQESAAAALPESVREYYHRGDSASHESHLMSWLRDEQSNCNPRWRLR